MSPADGALHSLHPAGAMSGKKQKIPKPYVPVIEPDSLASNQIGRIVDAICEGPIEGFTHGDWRQDVYFDEVQAENFSGVTVHFRDGSPDQEPIPGFPSAELAQSVGVVLAHAEDPTVRSVQDRCDAIRVGLSTDGIYWYNRTNGDVRGWQINYRIGVRPQGGAVEWRVTSGVSGKTRSRYAWDHTIDLTDLGDTSFPLEVYVQKLGPQNSLTMEDYRDTLVWDAVFAVTYANLSYPYTACIGVEVRADQFQSIPATAYDLLLQRVRVPANHTPTPWDRSAPAQYETDSQPWDGSFKWAWSDNPAWIFYDLATSKRFGTGQHVDESMIDKWALYQIARTCDEWVDDGDGGHEPRFAANLWLATDEEAYRVFKDLASVFRGMVFWSSGGIRFSQDVPKAALHQFSPANVVGELTYSGTARRARHTACVVRYTDPRNFFQPAIVYCEKRDARERYGLRLLELTAFACTSRGQAMRAAKYALVTEWMERETCSWTTGFEGAAIMPGHVCEIVDPARGGRRWGGRLVDATTTTATLDADVTLPAGATCEIAFSMPDWAETVQADNDASVVVVSQAPATERPEVIEVWADWGDDGAGGGGFAAPFGDPNPAAMPRTVRCRVTGYDAPAKRVMFEPLPGDGSSTIDYRVRFPLGIARRTVTTAAGTTREIAFAPALPIAPEKMALWLLAEPSYEARRWQVISNDEQEDGKYQITALEFREEKFAEIESDIAFVEPPPGMIPPDSSLQVAPPTALTFTPELIVGQYETSVRLNIDWVPSISEHATGYEVRWRYESDPWQSRGPVVESNLNLEQARPGRYEVEVRSVSRFGQRSAPITGIHELGETTLIANANVTGLEIVGAGSRNVFTEPDCHLRWRLNAPNALGSEFADSQDGTGGAALFPFFKDYEVRVFDADRDGEADEPLRIAHTTDRAWTYTIEMNREDGALDADGVARIPRREFTVAVAVRDIFNRTSRFSRLTARNLAPALPSGIELSSGAESVWLYYTLPPDPDVKKLRVWASQTRAVLESIEGLTAETLVFDGPGNPAVWDWPTDTDCYLRFAACDDFDALPETLTLSGIESVRTGALIPDPDALPDGWLPGIKIAVGTIERAQIKNGEIIRAHIQDAAVDRAKIQDGEIVRAKLGAAAVGEAQIEDAAITTAKIGTAQIRSAQIDDLTIGTNHVKFGAISTVAWSQRSDWFTLGSGWVQALSVGHASKGSPVRVSFAGSVVAYSYAQAVYAMIQCSNGASWQTVGTTLQSFEIITSPGAGTWYFTLYLRHSLESFRGWHDFSLLAVEELFR